MGWGNRETRRYTLEHAQEIKKNKVKKGENNGLTHMPEIG